MPEILCLSYYYDWCQKNIFSVCKAMYKTPKLVKRMQRMKRVTRNADIEQEDRI